MDQARQEPYIEGDGAVGAAPEVGRGDGVVVGDVDRGGGSGGGDGTHDHQPLPASAASRSDDALLLSLVWLTRHHGRERTAESLLAGMPLDGLLGPDQALRVLHEAGYSAGLIQRKLTDIHPLLLPAVLLLREGDACVLLRRLEGAGPGGATFEVVMPGLDSHTVHATEAELAPEYTGIAIAAAPLPVDRSRTAADEAALRDPGSHWFWGTILRFAPYYRSALLASFLSNALTMATGIITSVIYDKVIPHHAFVTLWSLATGSFLALTFDTISRQLRSHLIDVAGRKADLIVGSLLFRQSLGVRMEHRPESAGAYAHHLAQIEVVREFFAGATLSALSDLPFILLYVGMTFVIGGPLGWVLVVAVPLILGMVWAVQGTLRRAMRANMAQQADLHGILVEAVEGLEDLKTTNAEGRFLHRYEQATAAAAASSLKARSISSWSSNLSMTAQQAVTLVMLVVGVYLINAGTISGGALIGAVMFANRTVGPLGSMVSLALRYQGARAAMASLDRLMAQPTERDASRTYVANHRITGRLALNEVSFAYPATGTDAAPTVLHGVNLKIAAGERVVVLGRIGSGKSTVLRLLAGLYQPTEGMVEVDGLDLRQLDPADFRAKVGFVSQEPRLFKGSLRDNVLMGRTTVDSARLAEVARVTGLDRVVAGHPQGWDLSVGEMGALLSGGQRQLVALARCLVTEPQILLMDEPTSSMDAQSEVLFIRQLHAAAGDRTLVMVTHRPAVLELAQRVIVVDAGKVVLDGPKALVLAALSGARPAASAAPSAQIAADGGAGNLHMHPTTQPIQQQAAV